MPATVIAERIGWPFSIRTLSDRDAELGPAYLPPNPASRTAYAAGEIAHLFFGTTAAIWRSLLTGAGIFFRHSAAELLDIPGRGTPERGSRGPHGRPAQKRSITRGPGPQAVP
jgi:hypothetical protein